MGTKKADLTVVNGGREVPVQDLNHEKRWSSADKAAETLNQIKNYIDHVTSSAKIHGEMSLYKAVIEAVREHSGDGKTNFRLLDRNAKEIVVENGKEVEKSIYDHSLGEKVENILERGIRLDSEYSLMKEEVKGLSDDEIAVIRHRYMPELNELKAAIGRSDFPDELERIIGDNKRKVTSEALYVTPAGINSENEGYVIEGLLKNLGLTSDQVYVDLMKARVGHVVQMYAQGAKAKEFLNSNYGKTPERTEKASLAA